MTASDEAEPQPRLLFVTGRLAEFALRSHLKELEKVAGFQAEIAVLPITVAALMPTKWIARHLEIPHGINRIILPGLCKGDLALIAEKAGGVPVERGPEDLRDLPRFFGKGSKRKTDLSRFEIAILAEINHAPQLTTDELLQQALSFARQGADIIDLGCDPGGPWAGVADAVKALRDRGMRVSIDSFDRVEVEHAVRAGAELVLSVNQTNREYSPDWGWKWWQFPTRWAHLMASIRPWSTWRLTRSGSGSIRFLNRSDLGLQHHWDVTWKRGGSIQTTKF